MPELTLYKYDSCPFCARVRQFMQANGLELPMKDILQDNAAFRELLSGGGSQQVPCLRIETSAGAESTVQWLYESMDIIAYLQQHLVQPSQA